MTIYEIISLVISVVAILIPFFQMIWKKVFQKPKIKYYTDEKSTIFFNRCGSYIKINGVIEAMNQPVSIKRIDAVITRAKDGKKKNLSWSIFISPINQNFIGNYTQTTEVAHPFRIPENSITCTFIEFSDEFQSSLKSINLNTKDLYSSVKTIINSEKNYEECEKEYKSSDFYNEAKQKVTTEFFWEISKYDLKIIISYLNKKKEYNYQFEIDSSDNYSLNNNIEEVLLYPLKQEFKIPTTINTAEVELHEKN